MSVTYSTAHGNAGSSTPWARPGNEPMFSWILGFGSFTTQPQCRLLPLLFLYLKYLLTMVDLQRCVDFYCIAKRLDSVLTHTHIHRFSDSFLMSVIAGYRVEFPVLYGRSPLAIRSIRHRVHMPLPNSQSLHALHLSLWLL